MSMLLKKYKAVYSRRKCMIIKFFRITKATHNCCGICKYENTNDCLGSTICGYYVFHLEFSGKILRSLKYTYFIDQKLWS